MIRVTKVERDAGGFWRARVTVNGRTVAVDRSCGSWQAPEGKGPALNAAQTREVLPAIARELQARVRRLETRERRNVDQADDVVSVAITAAVAAPPTEELKLC